MSSNQQIIETKSRIELNSKFFNLNFLKTNPEMMSTNSALNFYLRNSEFNSRPLLKSRVKLHRSFKRNIEPVKKCDLDPINKAPLNFLTATGFGHKAETTKQIHSSPVKMNTHRKSNLSRTLTLDSRLNKNFDSVIDGRALSESRQNYQTAPNSSMDQHSQKLPDLNFNLPDLPLNSNYSILNTNKELLSELKGSGKKMLPLNQNSIKRIRKLLNLDGFSSSDSGPRPKLPNKPKIKTPPLFQSTSNDKQDINELVLSITHIKPSPVSTSINLDGERKRVNETPMTKSSLSTRENENKYADYFYFEQSQMNVYEPIKIVFSDKAPPSTPQMIEEQCDSLNEECKCLLCEKEALLREKYVRRLRKKQEKQLKESGNFQASDNLLPCEIIDKNIAECLNKNVQYSSSHPIISLTVKK